MNECPACGTLLRDGHAACPGCGREVREESRTCEHCKETIAADAATCPACGHLAAPTTCDRHPDREAPGRCALCGVALCAECDHGQGHYHLCEDHRDVPVTEGWAQVLAIPDEVEAHLIEDNLHAEGIEARVLSQKDHFAIPVGFGDLSRVRIVVPTYAYREAERLIAAHSDAAGEVSFGCPHCGEPYEEGERVCSACGEALI